MAIGPVDSSYDYFILTVPSKTRVAYVKRPIDFDMSKLLFHNKPVPAGHSLYFFESLFKVSATAISLCVTTPEHKRLGDLKSGDLIVWLNNRVIPNTKLQKQVDAIRSGKAPVVQLQKEDQALLSVQSRHIKTRKRS